MASDWKLLGYLIYSLNRQFFGQDIVLELIFLATKEGIPFTYDLKIDKNGIPKCESVSSDISNLVSLNLINKDVYTIDDLWDVKTYRFSIITEFSEEIKEKLKSDIDLGAANQIRDFVKKYKSDDEIRKAFLNEVRHEGRKLEIENL